MRRTHIPTALLLCLSKEQRFTEKERQRTFWSALYLSLFELLSQTSCFRCLKNKILQHLPVIRTNYWCHTLFDTHRKRSCQVRLTSSPALYFRHAQKTHLLRKIDGKSRTICILFVFQQTEISQSSRIPRHSVEQREKRGRTCWTSERSHGHKISAWRFFNAQRAFLWVVFHWAQFS